MQRQVPATRRERGMTIIELVAVIVVSGIMATGIVTYVVNSAQGVNSSASRNQLASAGRVAVDRLAMELQNALPGSIRHKIELVGSANVECIEFVPIRGATSYIDPPFDTLGNTFDVVDFVPTLDGATDGYAVIYPNTQSQLYDGDNGPSAGWPEFENRGPIQTISSASSTANLTTVTLTKPHRFNRRSPVSRFFVADEPISYCMTGSNLYRYSNYGFFAEQSVREEAPGSCGDLSSDTCLPNYSAAPDKMLISNSLDSSASSFSVNAQSLNRNALVLVKLTFASQGDSVTLSHEILSRSVP